MKFLQMEAIREEQKRDSEAEMKKLVRKSMPIQNAMYVCRRCLSNVDWMIGWYASLLFSSFQKFDIIWTLIWKIYTNMHSLKYFFKYYHSVFANNCFNIILSWLGYRSTYSCKPKNKSGYYDSIHFQHERLCCGW